MKHKIILSLISLVLLIVISNTSATDNNSIYTASENRLYKINSDTGEILYTIVFKDTVNLLGVLKETVSNIVYNNTIYSDTINMSILELQNNDTVDRYFVNNTFLSINTYSGNFPNTTIASKEATWDAKLSSESDPNWGNNYSAFQQLQSNDSTDRTFVNNTFLPISTYSGNFPNSTVAANLITWNATYNTTYDSTTYIVNNNLMNWNATNITTVQAIVNSSILNTTVNASQILFEQLGISTYVTAQDWMNIIQSASIIDGFELNNTRNPSELDVNAGNGLIKSTDSNIGQTRPFTLPATTNISLSDNAASYIYINYSSGSPTVMATTDRTTVNINTAIVLGRVYKEGATLTILTAPVRASNLARTEHERLVDMYGFAHSSGAIISQVDGLKLGITPGKWYIGHNPITTTAIDTYTGGNTFKYVFYNGTNWITYNATATTFDYKNYSDGDNTLAPLTNNKYGVHWVYITQDSKVYVIYGTGDYTLAQAQTTTPPTNIPPIVSTMGELLGRFIIKQDGTFISADTIFTTQFSTSGTFNHNEAAGLQGGTSNEYYHLSSSQYSQYNPLVSTVNGNLINWNNTYNSTYDSKISSKWTASGSNIYYNSGNVGIGTTSPARQLEVYGSGGGVRISRTSDLYGSYIEWYKGATPTLRFTSQIDYDGGNNGRMQFVDASGNYALSLAQGGNVGIGTTSPSTKLQITGAGGVNPTTIAGTPGSINFYNTNGGTTNSIIGIFGAQATDGGIVSGIGFGRENEANWGSDIRFYTHPTPASNIFNITERMRINADGNVGIGTTSPIYKLDINTSESADGMRIISSGGHAMQYIRSLVGSEAGIALQDGATTKWSVYKDTSNNYEIYSWNTAHTPFQIQTDDDVVLVQDGGNVGIGTTNPDVTLKVDASGGGIVRVVRSSAGSGYIQMESDGTNGALAGNADVLLNAGGSERVRIKSGGNVGIGTTNPLANLDVFGGTIGLGGRSAYTSNLTRYISSSVSGDRRELNIASLGTAGDWFGKINFLTSYSTEIPTINMVIDSNNVGIGTTSPSVNLHINALSDTDVLRIQDTDGSCVHNPEAGSETVTCSSDEKLKKDIITANKSIILNNLTSIPLKSYTVKASNDSMIGVIAQEYQTLYPDKVHYLNGTIQSGSINKTRIENVTNYTTEIIYYETTQEYVPHFNNITNETYYTLENITKSTAYNETTSKYVPVIVNGETVYKQVFNTTVKYKTVQVPYNTTKIVEYSEPIMTNTSELGVELPSIWELVASIQELKAEIEILKQEKVDKI